MIGGFLLIIYLGHWALVAAIVVSFINKKKKKKKKKKKQTLIKLPLAILHPLFLLSIGNVCNWFQ
jgi:NADH:ubiquinone oxidoreductase subunit 6 (subunit J)